MNESVQMEVGEGERYVVGHVQLDVVRKRLGGAFKKSTEALVTQFHEEHREMGFGVTVGAEVLDDVWVAGRPQEVALLLKPAQVGDCSGVTEVKESGVHDLCSTDETITLCLAHTAIRSSP